MSDLLALPLELLIHIFALLEGHEIVRCISVCSHFKHAIENSIALQYLIKLDMFGYTDGPGRADSVRLSQLERHINAWNNLDWVESRIDVPASRGLIETLHEGIYAISDITEVKCIQLPSLNRGVPLRTWTLGFEFPVRQIEIDPSNNLLVVLSMTPGGATDPANTRTFTLHLRTLSDNTPHPSATSPILFSEMIPSQHHRIRVLGLLLGLADVETLEIWNWATGQKIMMVGTPSWDRSRPAFCSFGFLNTTSFLLPCDGRLEVYQIPVESPGAPPIRIASFCMPHLIPGYAGSCWLYFIPRVLHNIDRLANPSPLPPPPFRVNEDSRCIDMGWMAFDVHHRGGNPLNIRFQVPLSSLRHSTVYPNPLAIPWDVWSKGVYFLKKARGGVPYEMSGGRLIDLTHSSDSYYTVSLLHLNRYRAGVLGTPNEDSPIDDDRSRDPTKSDVFPLGEVKVEHRFPVRLASRSLSFKGYRPSLLICDDECIMIWADPEFDPEAPDMTAGAYKAHKLIILSF